MAGDEGVLCQEQRRHGVRLHHRPAPSASPVRGARLSPATCSCGPGGTAPGWGRFLSPDPLGYVDSYDLYGYAAFDPINRWDPFGLESKGFARSMWGGFLRLLGPTLAGGGAGARGAGPAAAHGGDPGAGAAWVGAAAQDRARGAARPSAREAGGGLLRQVAQPDGGSCAGGQGGARRGGERGGASHRRRAWGGLSESAAMSAMTGGRAGQALRQRRARAGGGDAGGRGPGGGGGDGPEW